MRYYLLIVGVLCILYYVVMALYSKRLNSTFAGFWLIAGGIHLILGCMPLSSFADKVLGGVFIALWLLFLSVEWKIVRAAASTCRENLDVVIILGAQVRGRLITNSLKRRLDAALAYLGTHPDTKVVVSGGKGPDEEISEADAMAEYLIGHGVSPAHIFREDESASTEENFKFSRKYIDIRNEKVGIVTNDFHICRARMTARRAGYGKVYLIPASSNPVFQINYLVREFFAVLYLMRPKRKEKLWKENSMF